MKFKLLRTIIYCALFISGYTQKVQAQNKGFVQQEIIKVSGILTDDQIYSLNAGQKQTSRTYFDGLGRPVQSISIKASPTQKDIIQTYNYDNLGRQTVNYLPYAGGDGSGSYNTNAKNDQLNFYANGTTKIARDSKPYTAQTLEDSPLQRLLAAGSPGEGFQPQSGDKYKSFSYRSNNATDAARVWNPDGSSTTTYSLNTLSVTEAVDEQGFKNLQFTDAMGKVVLKRQYINEVIEGKTETYLDTYYVYDDAGAIKYTIPPKAVVMMRDAVNWNVSLTGIDNLLFKYGYDSRGRLVEKTVPGAGPSFIIYDPLNRPVLIQDGNLRNGNKWNYFKYNAKGRVISQGIYADAVHIGRSAMQTYVSSLTGYSTTYFEDRTATLTNEGYYTNLVFPTVSITPLAYNYYDDYDFNYDESHVPDYTVRKDQALKNGETDPENTLLTRGFLTGSWRKTIGAGVSTWLINVIFYDKNGRAIQTLSNNQLNASTVLNDSKTVALDFTGKAKQIKVVKSNTTGSTTAYSLFTYDHASRLIAIDQYNNTETAATRVAGYVYNEIGQLIRKDLHGVNPGTLVPDDIILTGEQQVTTGQQKAYLAKRSITLADGFTAQSGSIFTAAIANNSVSGYLQSVDFRYNSRGALTSINNSTLANDGGITNDDTNDLFGMEIAYDRKDASLTNSNPYYNGLVSSIKWRALSPTNDRERSYWFTYDNIGRLKDANYQDRSVGGTWSQIGAYNENNITYDHQGNIKALKRNTILLNNPSVIKAVDDLSYTYNGNQLTNVTDGVGGDYALFGFKNTTASANPYIYNANSGNLETDAKKGITISYNDLNRTDKIAVSATKYLTYTYDVNGSLLRKQAYDNNVLQKTTDYIDGFVYENSALVYFPMAEGRVRNEGGVLKYEYMIADNMGNVRVSFENDGAGNAKLTQENSYYPFGLTMPGNYVLNNPANDQLYNGGAEWQNDFDGVPELYNTYYRNYDPALGRFIAVDPKAEATDGLSVYHYAGNNPILFNDPLGDRYQRIDVNNRGYLRPFSPSLAFDRSGQSSYGWASAGFSNRGYNGMYAPNQAELYRQELENASKFGQTYTAASLKRILGQVGGLQSGSYYANADGNIVNVGTSLPEVEIAALRNGKIPSWWGNTKLFVDAHSAKTNSNSSSLTDFWYSPTVRWMIPDMINVNINISFVPLIGSSHNYALNIFTRGKDAGIHLTYTPSLRAGFHGDLSVNGAFGYYLGDARNATLESFLGKGYDVSADLEAVGIGVWSAVSESNKPIWVGGNVGVGPGIGGSGGQGNTYYLGGLKF